MRQAGRRMEKLDYEDFSQKEAPECSIKRWFTCWINKDRSVISAGVLILNAVLAPGIMDLPEAFSRAGGIGVGIGLQLFLLFFIIGSMYTLVRCAQLYGRETYPDVISVVLGPTAEVASAVCVTLYCYLFCACSLIIVGDQWEKVFSDIYGSEWKAHWWTSRYFAIPMSGLLLCLPLCLTKKIEFLANFSVLGIVAIAYCVGLVIFKYITSEVHKGDISFKDDRWRDILSVIPIWCGNYQCHVEIVPIVATLRFERARCFSLVLFCAMFTCVSFYTLTATFGFLTFGPEVGSDILIQYTFGPYILTAAIALAFKMCMTYPILHFCGRRAIENLWVKGRGLTWLAIVDGELVRRLVITSVTFTLVLIVSLAVPNLSVIMPVLGCVSAILMFLFPGCCLVQLFRNTTSPDKKLGSLWIAVAATLMTSLGAFVVGFSLSDLVVQFINPNSHFFLTGEEAIEEKMHSGDGFNNTARYL